MPSFRRVHAHRIYRRRIDAPQRILIGIALWCVAELCAFALVASVIGIGGALLLGLLTSLIGFLLLRKLGQGAARNFRQVLETRGLVLKPGSLLDGSFAAFGAALLILPGFLSDLAGLALSAPSIRGWLSNWLARKPTHRPPQPHGRDQVIDLGAQDWRRIDDAEPDLHGHR